MIQIELQPGTEARYAAEAHGRGMALEQYIAEKLETDAVRTPKQEKNIAAKLADLEVFFKEFAKYTDKIPHIPAEALTREAIYGDHL